MFCNKAVINQWFAKNVLTEKDRIIAYGHSECYMNL